MPTLVMITAFARRPGDALSQRPMSVSDSPPRLPLTHLAYTLAVSTAFSPPSKKRSRSAAQPRSSTVQPKTLPPKTSGAISMPLLPRGRFVTGLSVECEPGTLEVLLLVPALGPVANARRENRLQPRPLHGGEGHRVIALLHVLPLALDDVGGDVGAGHLARERVARVELVAGRGRLLLAEQLLRDEGRARAPCKAAFDQVGGLVQRDLLDRRHPAAIGLDRGDPAVHRQHHALEQRTVAAVEPEPSVLHHHDAVVGVAV